MLTVPDAAEASRTWLKRKLRGGMNGLRMNCAREGRAEWARTLRALYAARRDTGLECRVLMDLGGPKIRTRRTAEGRRVATWKVHRDELGKVVAAASVVLRPVSRAAAVAEGAVLFLDD